jgi:hypothetical protein
LIALEGERYLAFILLGSLVATSVGATTALVVVIPDGIVIGIDGKWRSETIGAAGKARTGTIQKMFLLKQRLAVADLMTERFETSDKGAPCYDFPAWIEKVNQKTDSKMSVDTLADVIGDQASKTFACVGNEIKSGRLTEDEAKRTNSGLEETLVYYMIGGYESGIPTIYSVTLKPNWILKTIVGPFKTSLHPIEGQSVESRIFPIGRQIGIARVDTADSNEQKKFATKVPIEFSLIATHQTLSMEQASNVVRALLGIEAETEPDWVGFPITVVTIPKSGDGWIRTYTEDIARLSCLCETTKTKQKERTQHH